MATFAQAQRRIQQLEAKLAKYEGNGIVGHESTMPDTEYQLSLTPLINRASSLQPNSGVYTKIDKGYNFQSYSEISKRGQKLASSLQKLGIKTGDCVASFMFNNGRHFLIHYTSACYGLVLNALNFRLFVEDLVYIINHVGNKLVFVDELLLPEFEKIPLDKLKTIKTVVICGQNESPSSTQLTLFKSRLQKNFENVLDFDEFIAYGNNTFVWPKLHERSGVNVCFTSGTTGRPKGVIYSHRSCAIHVMSFLMTDFLSVSGKDCWLPLAPMFHAGAWCIPYVAMCSGFKVVLNNQYSDGKTQINMIKDHNVTLLSGVPTVLQTLRMEYEKNPMEYSAMKDSLSRIMTGGSAPPPELIRWYKDQLNTEVIQIWGMTEMNPIGTYGRRVTRRCDLNKTEDELLQNQLVVGIPIPSVELKVVDPEDFEKEVPWDGKSVGELLVRGNSTCNAYFNVSDEIMKKKFYKGWLITGDLSARTKSGQLIIKDRSKDMIKSGGEWISSVDLENHVMGIKGVDKACVVAVPHKRWMQRPIVIVQLRDGVKESQVSLDIVRKHCSSKFAKFQLPDDVLYWDEIPLTGTGKMSKKDARSKLKDIGYVHPSERKRSKL